MRFFLSYARENSKECDTIFEFLDTLGVDVWMDRERLVVGDKWLSEISASVDASNCFVFVASKYSISKDGVIGEERDLIRQRLHSDPESKLLVVRLDKYPLPLWMTRFQYCEFNNGIEHPLFDFLISREPGSFVKSRSVLVNTNGLTAEHSTQHSEIRYQVPKFFFLNRKSENAEINSVLQGEVSKIVLAAKGDFSQPKEPNPKSEKNQLDVKLEHVFATDEVVSLKYDLYLYYSGAAHGMHGTHVLNLDLVKLRDIQQTELLELGYSEDELCHLIKAHIPEDYCRWENDEPIASAIRSNLKHGAYYLTDREFVFWFGEYELGPYAAGPLDVRIPYKFVKKYISKEEGGINRLIHS